MILVDSDFRLLAELKNDEEVYTFLAKNPEKGIYYRKALKHQKSVLLHYNCSNTDLLWYN